MNREHDSVVIRSQAGAEEDVGRERGDHSKMKLQWS